MADQHDIVAQVKDRNRIEDVIEESGYPLPKRGRYMKCSKEGTGGLVVDSQRQMYFWNSKASWGDVIGWMQNERGMDFKGAVEYLAKRAKLPDPNWGHQDMAVRIAARQREDALEVAQRIFSRWLWKNPEAQAYAMGRGWSDWEGVDEEGNKIPGTMVRALLGYSGSGTDEERREMIQALNGGMVEQDSPAWVAVMGFKGNIGEWGKKHNVTVENEEWVLKGYIPGMIGYKRLVYPHVRNGRVVYLSARAIGEKRHHNLPECLAGKKQVFFNQVYSAHADMCVVVEGQADAVSLGQWGIPAVALAGVKAGEVLSETLKRHKALYVGMDMDTAGMKAAWELADSLGPVTRLVVWKTDTYPTFRNKDGVDQDIKDANDLLKAMTWWKLEADRQQEFVEGMLKGSPTYVEAVAAWANSLEGADRDEAVRKCLGVAARMEDLTFAQYRAKLSKTLQITVRELLHMIKTLQEKAKENGDVIEDFIPTLGGVIDGFVVEYLYDPETGQASLAWRDPNGGIMTGDNVMINGKRYVATEPTGTIRDGGVLFPSKLGPLKDTREMTSYVEMFIRSVYMLPKITDAKIMSYYVLLTWMYDAFEAIPYLRATGEPGSGKSELMRRVGLICYRRTTANGASTTATLFRMVEKYSGTVFLDEMDLRDSDAANDLIKFINLGAMKNNPITRLDEVMTSNGKEFSERMYRTFCPKLIAMQRDFRDPAVGTRCITFKVQPFETFELMQAGISLNITNEMRAKALALRNMLLHWRLKNWQGEIEIDPSYYDMDISSRLNQVTGPLMALAKDDQALQSEIKRFLREYYAELVLSKSMTITARVIEAIWKIWKYPDLHKEMIRSTTGGDEKVLVGNVTRIANEIINDMNSGGEDEGEDNGKKGKRDELSPHRIGRVLREELQLRVSERTRQGYYLYWDEVRMKALAKRFGVKPENFDATSAAETPGTVLGPGKKEAPPAEPTQESLV